jgi:RHS repeat-associated protein
VVSFGYDPSNQFLTSVTDVMGGVTHYGYDLPGTGLLTSILDPNQASSGNPQPTLVDYDAQGRVLKVTDPLGHPTSYDYEPAQGLQTSTAVTDASGHETFYDYPDGLDLTAITQGYGSADPATTTFTAPQLRCSFTEVVTDPDHHQTTYSYNGPNLTSVTDALGHPTYYSYNSYGEVTRLQDANGVTTNYGYDEPGHGDTGHGNITSATTYVSGSNASVTNYYYGDNGWPHPGDVTHLVDADGHTWQFTYYDAGYPKTQVDPLGNTTSYSYDAAGRQTSTTTQHNGTNDTTAYDWYASDQLHTVTDADGHVTATYAYDADGNLQETFDANNRQTTYGYDLANRLTTVTRADQTTIRTAYYDNNQVEDTIDGANADTHYTYDALGRLATVTTPPTATNPSGNATIFGYDPAGNQVTKADPGGTCPSWPISYPPSLSPGDACTVWGYDAANRLTSTTYSDGTTPNVSFGYDADNQRTSMTDGTGTSQWAWDALHRLTSYTNGQGATVTYSYNNPDLPGGLEYLDRPSSITYPTATSIVVNRHYNAAGLVDCEAIATTTGTCDPTSTTASGQANYSYNTDSTLAATTVPQSGVTDSYSYDGAGARMSIGVTHNGTTLASFSYERDPAQQVTSVTATGVPADSHTFGYSPLEQLNAEGSGPNPAPNYTYDAADNPTQLVQADPTSGQLTIVAQGFDPANELCWSASGAQPAACGSAPSGATTYGYDTRGNLTTITPAGGSATTLSYDQGERLTSYGSAATYSYDGDGLRAAKTVGGSTRHFSWDGSGGAPLLLSDGTNAYVYNPDGTPLAQLNASGAVTAWYHNDQSGSTRVLTDNTGSVIGTASYDTYGRTGATSGTTTALGYDGQYTDGESGLIYLRARYYDPTTAQFLTRDPLGAVSHMAYGYSWDSPLNAGDPTGQLSGWGWVDVVAAGVAVVGGCLLTFCTADLAAGAATAAVVAAAADPNLPDQAASVGEDIASAAANVADSLAAETEGGVTDVFRVEGPGNARLDISPAGDVGIKGENALFLNFGDEARAQEFLATRLEQGFEGTTIKSFQVFSDYVDALRASAVPESLARQFPDSPVVVDVNQAADQFGLRAANFEDLLNNIIPGSGFAP